MHDAKLTSDDGESAEESANEDVPRTQGCFITDECENASMSSNEQKNHQLLVFSAVVLQEIEVEESKKLEQAEAEESKRFEDATSGSFSGKELIVVEEETRSEDKRTHVETSGTTAGSSDKSADTKGKKRVFSLIDILISLSLVGPLVIGFWRGVWAWMDLHDDLFPAWFCFMSGAALHVIFAFYKDRFHDTYMDEWSKLSAFKRLPYRALRILYTYIFGVACNAHWRGSWIIINDYLVMHIWITTCLIFLLLACLAILRCIRNLIAPPLIIFTDTATQMFQFPTRYNLCWCKMILPSWYLQVKVRVTQLINTDIPSRH